jgi:predicted nucleotidyltransferase
MNTRLDPPVQGAIEYFARELRDVLGPQLRLMKLFGSHARGEASAESDVDIFVLVKERTPEIEAMISDAAFKANLACDQFIAPTVYGEQEFNHPVLRASPFLQSIEREGILE